MNIKLKQRILIFLFLIILPLVSLWLMQKKLIVFQGVTMGTNYVLKLYVPQWVNKVNVEKAVIDELNRHKMIFSTWEDQSEISKFNQSQSIKPYAVSNELYDVVLLSKQLYEQSNGFFDPTIKPLLDLWGFNALDVHYKVIDDGQKLIYLDYIGMDKLALENNSFKKAHPKLELDLSSIAKGYIVDQVALVLESYSAQRYMIEIGGEIKVKANSAKDAWVLGIQQPDYKIYFGNLYSTIQLTTGAFATSGDYRNYFIEDDIVYSHIFDPVLGAPVSNTVASVSVIAPSCALADGLATMLMTMGVSKGLSYVEAHEGIEALFIVRDADLGLESFVSSGFEHYTVK